MAGSRLNTRTPPGLSGAGATLFLRGKGGERRSHLWVIEGWCVVEHGGERRVVRGTCGEESDV